MTAVRIAVILQPISERRSLWKETEFPSFPSTFGAVLETAPKPMHMLTVASLDFPGIIEEHPPLDHYRFESTFGTKPIQLVCVRPTMVLEEQICILPVTAARIDEIVRIRYSCFCFPQLNLPTCTDIAHETFAEGRFTQSTMIARPTVTANNIPWKKASVVENTAPNHVGPWSPRNTPTSIEKSILSLGKALTWSYNARNKRSCKRKYPSSPQKKNTRTKSGLPDRSCRGFPGGPV